MLEAIIIYFLCKRVGEKAEEKGYTGCALQILAVMLWFAGEVIGAIVGIMLTRGEGGLLIYACGIIGAALGALTINVIVALLPVTEEARANAERDRISPYRRTRPADAPAPAGAPAGAVAADSGTLDSEEQRRLMLRAAVHEDRRQWAEALRLYQEVANRALDGTVVGEARDRIDEIRDRLRQSGRPA